MTGAGLDSTTTSAATSRRVRCNFCSNALLAATSLRRPKDAWEVAFPPAAGCLGIDTSGTGSSNRIYHRISHLPRTDPIVCYWGLGLKVGRFHAILGPFSKLWHYQPT